MDFSDYLSLCRHARSSLGSLFASQPEEFSLSSDGESVLFLAAKQGKKELFSQGLRGSAEWTQLQGAQDERRELSKAEQLLRERMRASGSGITSYKYLEKQDALFVQSGPTCCIRDRKQECPITSQFPVVSGSIDHKLCPATLDLLSCVQDGDLHVCHKGGAVHRLTHTGENRDTTHLTAGAPSFIIQEEFNRYTGYWWRPEGDGDTHYILYEEVDESGVEEMTTFDPSSQTVQRYRYPVPGSPNATSRLRLIRFSLSDDGAQVETSTLDLSVSLSELLPDTEYLVRAGWTPDVGRVWVVVLDRAQSHLRLATIDLRCFTPRGKPSASGPAPPPVLLWEEHSEHWINFNDPVLFLPPSPSHPLRLLLPSSHTGYTHLVMVEMTGAVVVSSHQITTGNWCVLGDQVWVDEERDLVYFEANTSSPTHRHLYVAALSSTEPCSEPKQLTKSGFYHKVSVFPKQGYFVDVFSSPSQPPCVDVWQISHDPSLSAQLCCSLHTAPPLHPMQTPPQQFSFPCVTGEVLYGVVYPPINVGQQRHDSEQRPSSTDAEHKYPTVLFVYGGPHVQLVTEEFNRWQVRIQAWRMTGFAVVTIDNRGSANRGMQFEAHVKGHMGGVEVQDQVEGLHIAAKEANYLDLNRVAIVGWSYGGYMALMALAQHTYVFKVAVAGAPVTDWMLYDTGYTERYLGVPPASKAAYSRSSVLQLVPRLPSMPGRLLILHGLDDENVFFSNTSKLLQSLVAAGKPYSLQVYIGERHGLRSQSSALHCDSTILSFLLQNL